MKPTPLDLPIPRPKSSGLLLTSLGTALALHLVSYAQVPPVPPQPVRTIGNGPPPITSMALSQDGELLLTGHEAKAGETVQVWDMVSGEPLRQFGEHLVWVVGFSPDKARIVTGGSYTDPHLRIWDTATGQELMKLELTGGVHAVAFSPDGQYLLTSAGRSSCPRLWDATTGREVRRFEGHAGEVYSVAFSPSGDFVLTGSHDGTARLWNLHTGQEERRFVGNSGGATLVSAAFSGDGRCVVTKQRGASPVWGLLRVWDATTGQEIRRFERALPGVGSVAFSPDGRYLLEGNNTGWKLWDAVTGAELLVFRGTYGETWEAFSRSHVNAALFTPDGHCILAGGQDGAIKVWDIRTLVPHLQIIRRFEGVFCQGCWGGFQRSSRDSQCFLTRSSALRMWDVASGSLIRSFSIDPLAPSFSAALSADAQLLATGIRGGDVVLWNVTTREELYRLAAQARSVAFSPDDRWILTWGWQSSVQLWDTATGQPLVEFEHMDGVDFAMLSPDGRRVVTYGSGLAVVHDTLTGTEIRRFDVDPSPSLNWPKFNPRGPRFTPDGDRLVVKGPEKGIIHVWDIGTGQEVQRIEHPLEHPFPEDDGVFFAVSPDGAQLLTGSYWHPTAHLWDIASGKELLQFEPGFQFEPGPLSQVQPYLSTLAFSPQGTLVLTAYQSGWDEGHWYLPAILWDATTGRELRHLRAWGLENFADFSPDGRFVLSWVGALATLWDIRDLVARPRFEQSENGPEIHWDLGTLQFAPTIDGPWTDLPAASPFLLSPVGDKGLFRVKAEE